MAGTYHLAIAQGAHFGRTFQWKDDAGEPVNLTDWTGAAHLRPMQASLKVHDWTPYLSIDGPTGTVALSVPATDADVLLATAQRGAGVWDLELTPPSGPAARVRFLEGTWTVSREVTRPSPGTRTAYQERIIADGAVAYWPLDDPAGSLTARELAGTRPATIMPSVVCGVPGVGGATAMQFVGAGGLYAPATPPLHGGLTWEAWVWSDIPPDQHGTVVTRRPTTGATYVPGATGSVTCYNATARTPEVGFVIWWGVQVPCLLRTWMHVAATHDGALQAVYVNGVLQGSRADANLAGDTGVPMVTQIGMETASVVSWFIGRLQDVAIYTKALTAEQVAAHYALRVQP